jgi:hypothetical protein
MRVVHATVRPGTMGNKFLGLTANRDADVGEGPQVWQYAAATLGLTCVVSRATRLLLSFFFSPLTLLDKGLAGDVRMYLYQSISGAQLLVQRAARTG